MSKETGGPAFPVAGSDHNYPIEGMTILDYFAAKAMLAIGVTYHDTEHDEIAKVAYKMADAMIKARSAISKATGE